jgi:hypothetical protein
VQEWLIPYLVVVVLMAVFGYSLFSHFTGLFESQMDVSDRILEHFRSIQEEEPISIDEDEGRTHVFGGLVHGDAICSDGCWCKEEEE